MAVRPKPVANATYLLSYDIGIGIGSLLMGCLQESIGLSTGFGLTAIAYVVGGVIYLTYADGYYRKLKNKATFNSDRTDLLPQYMKKEVYTLPNTATVRDAIAYFCEKNINAAPIVNATLQDACKLLSEAGVKKIPVVSGDKVVGIVSRSAITHYLQKRYLAHAAQTALS